MIQTIDKSRVEQRFQKSISSYDANAVVQERICEKLISLVEQRGVSSFDNVLEIGAGTGLLTRKLLERFSVRSLTLNDLVPAMSTPLQAICNAYKTHVQFSMGDAEKIEFPVGYDLVISASAIQWFTDFHSFMKKLKGILRPGGLVVLSTFAPGNLDEIRTLTYNGLQYMSVDDLENCLSQEFDVLSISEAADEMYFEDPIQVLKHLKLTGVNGNSTERWTQSKVHTFSEEYSQCFKTDKGYRLTYRPVYVVLR